jgi:ABC-type nitrate/sulfonate/bicarbonate transport system substrate-binding protein
MTRFATAALAAITLAVATTSQVAAAPAPPRTVSVALSGGQNTMFSAFLVAVGAGLFEKRGIKVDQQLFASGTASFAAFAGGSMPLCICGATQVLTAGASGRDVVSIFNLYHGGAVTFMAPKKYEQEKGTDLKKFDGLTWAYTAEGSVSQVFMTRAAQFAGLKWEAQKRLAIGGVEAFLPTLRSGRADLVTMDPMSGAKALALGIGYPVFNTNDPAVAEPIWGRQLGLPMVATRAWLDKNPELAQDVVDALREGLLLVQEKSNDPDALLRMMPPEYQDAYKTEFAGQWVLAKPAFTNTDGTFSDQAINDTVAFAKAVGVLKVPEGASFDPKRYFDNRYAEKAVAKIRSAPPVAK